ELARRLLEDGLGLILAQRRQRIVAPARRLEHVAPVDLLALQVAGLARHPKLIFGAIVVRLEISVAERPVDEGRGLRDRGGAGGPDSLRPGAKIVLVQPP